MNIIDRYTQFPLRCCLLYSFPLRFVFICWLENMSIRRPQNRLVFKMILRRFGEINLHLFPGHLKSIHNHCLQFYGYSPPLGKHALEILFITNCKNVAFSYGFPSNALLSSSTMQVLPHIRLRARRPNLIGAT